VNCQEKLFGHKAPRLRSWLPGYVEKLRRGERRGEQKHQEFHFLFFSYLFLLWLNNFLAKRKPRFSGRGFIGISKI
jgi:hypothetical protein